MHANFSTEEMRTPKGGKEAIDIAVQKLKDKHLEHIAIYGENLGERLTGRHETSNMFQFSIGNADRGSSIRIPSSVLTKGYGYIEDRRPGANADPYLVAAKLISTICNIPMLSGCEYWCNSEVGSGTSNF